MPSCSHEYFLKNYCQPEDRSNIPGGHTRGYGGASTGVERWKNTATGEDFAVKRLSLAHHVHFPHLIENEVKGVMYANKNLIPRVVKFEDLILLPNGDALVILELVEGISLNNLLADFNLSDTALANVCQHEQQVMEIAAQLMETVHFLHNSNLAHLDITSSNIMLRKEGYGAWDQLRLLDFGFAQYGNRDMSVNPQGAPPAYAAPELLRSLQLQCQGAGPADPGLLIDGFAADWWAIGIVLFELLTGELPFRGKAATKAPECLDSLCKEQWEDYEGVLQAQQSWVQACEVAFQTGSEVQHPLLDRVRQCSTAPDRAASFFLQLFHPVPLERFRAVDHAWCARAVASMRDEHDCAAFALAVAEARLKKSNSFRQRAARFLCCGGASPTSKADSHVGHERSPANIIKSSKWWKVPQPAKHRHQRSRDVAACTDASVHSQNGPVQADSCQMPALTAFQGITFGASRQADQQVTEELPQAMADPVQIATADGFDTTPLALPKQAAHVRAVSVTASASSAHEPQVQSLQQQSGVSGQFGCQNVEGGLVKQHCSAGVENEQLVGGAPLPEEPQEQIVDGDTDRGTTFGSGKKGWKSKGTRLLKRLLRR